MILLLDNYDSFVHNLARYLEELGERTIVRRNDEIEPGEILALAPRALVISPGPCDPARAGVSVPAVRLLSGRLPILGICLGHQAIAEALGGRVVRAPEPLHGAASPVHHGGRGIFEGLPSPFQGARYHSLVVEEASLPEELEVIAATPCGRGGRVVMALSHRRAPTVGLQFHPESVLTDHGHRLLSNFLALAAEFHGGRDPRPPAREEACRLLELGNRGLWRPSGEAPGAPHSEAEVASRAGAARAGVAGPGKAPA